MTLVSQAEYARRLGVTAASISQWKKAGRLVLQGSMVDVEATDAYLKRYRRDGLPAVKQQTEIVKRGRPSIKEDTESVKDSTESVKDGTETVKQSQQLNTETVRLTGAEILKLLEPMDFQQTFDWSDEAMAERAVLAAQCIGYTATTSDIRDDGHHGQWQIRQPAPNDCYYVVGGFGFELCDSQVALFCREEITPLPDDDDPEPETETYQHTVRLDLLPMLARPFYEWDKPK